MGKLFLAQFCNIIFLGLKSGPSGEKWERDYPSLPTAGFLLLFPRIGWYRLLSWCQPKIGFGSDPVILIGHGYIMPFGQICRRLHYRTNSTKASIDPSQWKCLGCAHTSHIQPFISPSISSGSGISNIKCFPQGYADRGWQSSELNPAVPHPRPAPTTTSHPALPPFSSLRWPQCWESIDNLVIFFSFGAWQ